MTRIGKQFIAAVVTTYVALGAEHRRRQRYRANDVGTFQEFGPGPAAGSPT